MPCWLRLCACCWCRELSKELQVNVLGYDYSGYGCSTGMSCPALKLMNLHITAHLWKVVFHSNVGSQNLVCITSLHVKLAALATVIDYLHEALIVGKDLMSYWLKDLCMKTTSSHSVIQSVHPIDGCGVGSTPLSDNHLLAIQEQLSSRYQHLEGALDVG